MGTARAGRPELTGASDKAWGPMVKPSYSLLPTASLAPWLGDNYGTKRGLWPAADAPERLQALSWVSWTYVSVGSAIKQLHLSQGEGSPVELRNEAMAAHARKQLDGYYAVLEQRLSKASFLLGPEYSLVDLVVASLVKYAGFLGMSPEPYPRLSSWQKGCMGRPALSAEWGG